VSQDGGAGGVEDRDVAGAFAARLRTQHDLARFGLDRRLQPVVMWAAVWAPVP